MLWQGEGDGEVSYFVLQRIQVLHEVHVLILQLISPLPDLAHSSLVLTHLVLEKKKKKAEIRPMGQQAQAKTSILPCTHSDSCQSTVEAVEASPGDGAGVEVDQLVADGGQGHLDALQILQQKQDTAIAHCQGYAALSTGPSPGASRTSFPSTAGH